MLLKFWGGQGSGALWYSELNGNIRVKGKESLGQSRQFKVIKVIHFSCFAFRISCFVFRVCVLCNSSGAKRRSAIWARSALEDTTQRKENQQG